MVKYSAIQGSTVTLLGLVKYDADKDELLMTELSAIFSGGMAVAKNKLDEQLYEHRKSYLTLLFCGMVLFGAAISVYNFRRNRIQR